MEREETSETTTATIEQNEDNFVKEVNREGMILIKFDATEGQLKRHKGYFKQIWITKESYERVKKRYFKLCGNPKENHKETSLEIYRKISSEFAMPIFLVDGCLTRWYFFELQQNACLVVEK